MTALVVFSNRRGNESYMRAAALTVAVDAQVNEFFTLPAGFGELHIVSMVCSAETFSAAYVAPAPPFDGLSMYIANAAGSEQDYLGASRFVHAGTQTGRPTLLSSIELYRVRLLRQDERLYVTAPILAGAGATATIACRLFGYRVSSY